jgi:hypothetical protein
MRRPYKRIEMNLRSRLSTLIAARVVIGTLLLGSAILIQISRPGAFPVDPFFTLIGLTYALSVVYLATLRFAERHPWLVDLQFGVDAVLVSAFIHVTGGIASNFSSLYVLPVIAASMIRSRRVALQVASLSAMLYLALVLVQYVDVGLPALVKRFTPVVELPTLGVARYTVAINLSGFFAVRSARRLTGRGSPFSRRATRIRVARDPRPPQVQRERHQQSSEWPGDDRRRCPHPDVQPGGGGHPRHSERASDPARRDRRAATAGGYENRAGRSRRRAHAQDRHPAASHR